MGQSLCRGSRDAVVDGHFKSTILSNQTSGYGAVDNQLDVSQRPIRLPVLSEELNEVGCDTATRGENNGEVPEGAAVIKPRPVVKHGVPAVENAVAAEGLPVGVWGDNTKINPEEVSEMDASNLPTSLHSDTMIGFELAMEKGKIQNGISSMYYDDDSQALDKSNMPIALDDPPTDVDECAFSSPLLGINNGLQYEIDDILSSKDEELKQTGKSKRSHRKGKSSEVATASEAAELDKSNMPIKLDERIVFDDPVKEGEENDFNSKTIDTLVISKSKSNDSMAKEERIEDSGFNKDVQLSPRSDSKQVITTLNQMKLESSPTAVAAQDVKTNEAITSEQSPNLVTNMTEKFAIMDLLATDYVRDHDKS